jgi:thiosulfate dehydrogenase [quinone] large subunit
MVRVSAVFGALLMMVYWTAHMSWPFIEGPNNFIVDFHVVYAAVCIGLIVFRAGHVWGLDGWAERQPFLQRHPSLRAAFA